MPTRPADARASWQQDGGVDERTDSAVAWLLESDEPVASAEAALPAGGEEPLATTLAGRSAVISGRRISLQTTHAPPTAAD
jgi:hypothetical protein